MNRRPSPGLALALLLALAPPARAQRPSPADQVEPVLRRLVESYGVSGHEAPVRDLVRSLLPAWARAEEDSAGNLWIRAGRGGDPVVFVAHLDEIGFGVDSIRNDGQLAITPRGGFLASLFEAEPALVHTAGGVVPGVFTPRDSVTATRTPAGYRVDVGTTSRTATEALGVAAGSTVTMPKSYRRLLGTRATGRAFDDRVGCAALLVAVRALDPARLRHEVIFVWSVREEVGLEGARAVANALGIRTGRVHAIDTFVSADTPVDPQSYAVAPLGRGPVIRALDNSGVTPADLVDSLRALARSQAIPLQYGTTNGGNDGSTFAPFGVPNVPVGWPLRYSHSPAEVVDLADVAALGSLVRAIAERW
jgi:putative aminopeptidase